MPGQYFLEAGGATSPSFNIGTDVYKGTADFCLRYMRQQRTGFNPFLNDSCHTQDGYVLYGQQAGIEDSSYVDVTGGWHDASDYLQYATTSANATAHLLMAYRDYPHVFADEKLASGLAGANGVADVLDEAMWGIQWLLKMNPSPHVMFNQIADDRDHMGMRMPGLDSFYGRGHQRPVYFVSGEPQQRGKFMNNTTGTSSTAAKFASAYALAGRLQADDSIMRRISGHIAFHTKARDAFNYAMKKPGYTQTASVKSPYIYAEENWVDDVEFAAASFLHWPQLAGDSAAYFLQQAASSLQAEPLTPWLGKDTAAHYQWYPFINLGHRELGRLLKKDGGNMYQALGATAIDKYKEGIEAVWEKARENAFYRGVPFIWCSNNLTTAFAMQCLWYRQLSGNEEYKELEQANIDWLFGCNPWGTSMVYGLPAHGDTPTDPHSAFTRIGNHPIDGGLVDGPVYGSIYNNLIGIKLYNEDEYALFQSNLAVYHDDYGDYSTNEPTMDGTASLIYLLAAREAESAQIQGNTKYQTLHGAINRSNVGEKKLALVFTGDQYAEGGKKILRSLRKAGVKASFFFTGNFYRNPGNRKLVKALVKQGHYLGAHGDQHLLYCDWADRNKLLVNRQEYEDDLRNNLLAMQAFGIDKQAAPYVLPSYEWHNDSIAAWTKALGLQLVNMTPGTLSHADYTTPLDKNYRASQEILQSIYAAAKGEHGLNGFLLLMHVGAGASRKDKLYEHLPTLLRWMKSEGYQLMRVSDLLE